MEMWRKREHEQRGRKQWLAEMLPVVNVIAVFTHPFCPLFAAVSRTVSLYTMVCVWGGGTPLPHTGTHTHSIANE